MIAPSSGPAVSLPLNLTTTFSSLSFLIGQLGLLLLPWWHPRSLLRPCIAPSTSWVPWPQAKSLAGPGDIMGLWLLLWELQHRQGDCNYWGGLLPLHLGDESQLHWPPRGLDGGNSGMVKMEDDIYIFILYIFRESHGIYVKCAFHTSINPKLSSALKLLSPLAIKKATILTMGLSFWW